MSAEELYNWILANWSGKVSLVKLERLPGKGSHNTLYLVGSMLYYWEGEKFVLLNERGGSGGGVLSEGLVTKIETIGIEPGTRFGSGTGFEKILRDAFAPENYTGDLTISGNVYARNFIKGDGLYYDKDIYLAFFKGKDSPEADGSLEKPYKTIDYALKQLPSTVTAKVRFYYIERITAIFSQYTLNLFASISWSKNPLIIGETKLSKDGFYSAGYPAKEFNNYVRTVFREGSEYPYPIKENECTGYLARYGEDKYAIIGSHGVNQLKSHVFTEGHRVDAVYRMQTTILFQENRMAPTLFFSNGKSIIIKNCIIKNPSGKNLNLLTDSVKLENCHIIPGKTLRLKGDVSLSGCLVSTNRNDANPLVSVVLGRGNELVSNIFEHESPESVTGPKPCVRLENGAAGVFMKNYISGFPVAVEYQPNTTTYSLYGHYPNHYENNGVLFDIKGSHSKNILSEWYGQHSIRVFNYNYIFSLNGGSQGMHFVFEHGQLLGDRPNFSVFVPKSGGEWNGKKVLTALKDKPEKYIDPVLDNRFYVYDQLYTEMEPKDIEVLVQNGTKYYHRVGDISQNRLIFINFVFERGEETGSGFMVLSNSPGTGLDYFVLYGRDSRVTFGKTIYGEILNLSWDDSKNPDGNDTILKLSIRRQMV